MADLNDPHVSVVEYLVEFGPHQVIDGGLDAEYETDLFRGMFTHSGKRFRCQMREHFSSLHEAREAVEARLRAWTIELGLKDGPSASIEFEFAGASLEDRNPSPGGPDHVLQPASLRVSARLDAVIVKPRRDGYPPPPADFVVTPTVDILWERYKRHRQGVERLPSFSQYVLTAVRAVYGGEDEAADALSLSGNVLRRLRQLSGWKGDAMSARKFAERGQFEPLSESEKRWLRSVTNMLIWRLGAHAAGTTLDDVSNEDLPDIFE